MNELCHVWMSRVIYEKVMSHTNDLCHVWMMHVTYEWVMSQMSESCATDGSKGSTGMGAGFNWHDTKGGRCCRVGGGTGGGSSGRAKFAAACLALEDSFTHDKPIVVLTDSKGFMAVSSNWVGVRELRLAHDWNRTDQASVLTNGPRWFQYLIRYWKCRDPVVKVKDWLVRTQS